MDYLESVDGLGIFVAQNYLWICHESERVVFGGGISAFPACTSPFRCSPRAPPGAAIASPRGFVASPVADLDRLILLA